MDKTMDEFERLLSALRQIIWVTDSNAKRLAKETGLTPPQLLILHAIAAEPDSSIGKIAKEINLTHATVTAIIDRMELRGLVARRRSEADRRVVHVDLTDQGAAVLAQAPKALQDRLQERFDQLKDWEKSFLIAALERVSALLDAEDVDAAPILDVGTIDRTSE